MFLLGESWDLGLLKRDPIASKKLNTKHVVQHHLLCGDHVVYEYVPHLEHHNPFR